MSPRAARRERTSSRRAALASIVRAFQDGRTRVGRSDGMTLRPRLTAAFVLVVLVPLVVGGLLVTRAFPRANEARQSETATASARLLATVASGYCDRARATAEAAGRAWTGAPNPTGARAIEDLVQRGLADGVRVGSVDGTTVVAAGRAPSFAEAGDCLTGLPGSGSALSAVVELTTVAGVASGSALASYQVNASFAKLLQ